MLPPPPPPNPTWEATRQSFAHFRDLVDHLPKSVYKVIQLKQELDSITRANWFLLCRESARPTRGRPAQSQAEALIRVLTLAVKQYFPYRMKAIEAVLQPICDRLSSPTYCYHSRLSNLPGSEFPSVHALEQALMALPFKEFDALAREDIFGEDLKALGELLKKEKRVRKAVESVKMQLRQDLAREAEDIVERILDYCGNVLGDDFRTFWNKIVMERKLPAQLKYDMDDDDPASLHSLSHRQRPFNARSRLTSTLV